MNLKREVRLHDSLLKVREFNSLLLKFPRLVQIHTQVSVLHALFLYDFIEFELRLFSNRLYFQIL